MPSLKAFWLDAQADGQKASARGLKKGMVQITKNIRLINPKKKSDLIAPFLNILFHTLELI